MNLRWGMHCHQARGVVTSVCSHSTTEVVSLVRLWSRAISDLTSAISYVRTFDNFCCPVGDNYLYVFKGALRAPGRGWQPRLNRRRATQALAPMRRSSPSQPDGVHPGNGSHAGRLVPLLGPAGHGGVGALYVPAPAAAGGPPQGPAPGAPGKSCHPPGDPALNRARSPSRARCARHCVMAQAPLLTLIFLGSFGAYREHGADWRQPLRQAWREWAGGRAR